MARIQTNSTQAKKRDTLYLEQATGDTPKQTTNLQSCNNTPAKWAEAKARQSHQGSKQICMN